MAGRGKTGGVYCNPASHGEGRFVADEAWLHRLIANGQVATQYVDDKGNVTMDEYWNPNGSYMAIEGITSLMDVSLARWLTLREEARRLHEYLR